MQTLLVSNTQINHETLAGSITLANPAFRGSVYASGDPASLSALNSEVTRQASMIAYVDDFWLMMILTLLAMPLLLLIRTPKKPATPEDREQVELAALE